MTFKQQLVHKILAGEKTVTRRPVKTRPSIHHEHGEPLPCRYEVGKSYAIQPGRGQKAVGRLFVTRIDREPLGGGLDWSISEAEREGFEDWPAFVDYWSLLYGGYDPTQLVDRIEFQRMREVAVTDYDSDTGETGSPRRAFEPLGSDQ